jgi:hypothetical protein
MQHMQQQRFRHLVQQSEAALTNISALSGNFSSAPGGVFSIVAAKLPKPIPNFGSKSSLSPWISASFFFFDTFLP